MGHLSSYAWGRKISSIIIELFDFGYDLFIYKPNKLFLNCFYPTQWEYFFIHPYYM